MTEWYHEDDVCWVADCEACGVPIVVWRQHGSTPGDADVTHMLSHLERVATGRFGAGNFRVDRMMRQIPEHFHAHARDPEWQRRVQAGLPPFRPVPPADSTNLG